MDELKHPSKPVIRNTLNVEETIILNENSEEEDYHMMCDSKKEEIITW